MKLFYSLVTAFWAPILSLVLTTLLTQKEAFIAFSKFNIYTQENSNDMCVESKSKYNPKLISLKNFFIKFNSPLANEAETFIEVAEKYDLDYKLLPSIACMESSCGKFIPTGSYNPFGWGVYGNTVTSFNSYKEAIYKVGEGISKNYISRGLNTPQKIAPIYTPPNSANWLAGVMYFQNKIN